ncbi:hypothetical protein ES703_73003 [subsurface metagenome]
MSPSGRDYSQWIGHIAERIVPGQILAQLFDHAKAVIARAWGKMRKAFQITLHDISGNARLAQVFFDQKVVKVSQQLCLRLIIGA